MVTRRWFTHGLWLAGFIVTSFGALGCVDTDGDGIDDDDDPDPFDPNVPVPGGCHDNRCGGSGGGGDSDNKDPGR